MATEKDEKTEQPTARRKDDAKKKGDIPRSKDLAASIGLLFTILFFAVFMPYFGKIMVAYWKKYLSRVGEIVITKNTADVIGQDFFSTYLKLVVPLFLLLVVVALLVEVVQAGGLKIVSENLRIKWEKVFFLAEIPKGLKKILGSVEALFELFKSVVKVVIIFFIAYFTIRLEIPSLLKLPATSLENILLLMGKIFLRLAFNITLFLLIISLLDYLWQRWRYTNKLKMSKQDVKDEFKQAEGDPQIKSQQKKIQFQWAMRRMMAEVPEADVVITNPTHYAVALKYEFQKMKSPKLLAKGRDLVAQRIKEVAREHGVPIVENPPVARAVYASVEINDFIPAELFKPIAEILAYIYKLKGKKVG
jgi:flagellar biosynthetic protein FlhB